jgi:hypothetical protein
VWRDIVLDIDNGYVIVSNIVAPPGNQPPGYPPDQYFTVISYNDLFVGPDIIFRCERPS